MKENLGDLVNRYRGAVMGFAALWISFYHLWDVVSDVPVLLFIQEIGFVGVDFFLLLSGMGLVHAAEKYSTRRFYRRRLDRVFLPAAVVAVVFKFAKGWSWGEFLRNLLGINFYTVNVLSFLWFIPAILTLYLLFPLYYRMFRRAGSKGWFTAGASAVWLGLTLMTKYVPALNRYMWDTWMYMFTNRIPIFLTGVYLGWRLRERSPEMPRWGWWACGAVFGLGLGLMALVLRKKIKLLVPAAKMFYPAYLLAVSGVPLLARGAQFLERYGRRAGKILVKGYSQMGRISLEFYCVQEYVGLVVWNLVGDYVPQWTANILMISVSIAAALALDMVCNFLRKGIDRITK